MSNQRPKVMGVLNITPDSFSDGNQFNSREAALDQARVLQIAGADIIDVGGESTRPGAERVPLQEEQKRVLPVIEALVKEGMTISIDTMNSETAELAVRAGASIINDVSGGKADEKMFDFFFEIASQLSPNIQIIVTDHANFKKENFQQAIIEEWRDGKKLVPTKWITDNN